MKKLILAAFALTTAASVFAQGTVQFVNNSSVGTSRVWGPSSTNPSLRLVGNAATDSPAGTVDYVGAGLSKIGTVGLTGKYGASTTFAQILAANGGGAAESSLTPQGAITTFRSGSAAGVLAVATATLAGIPIDSPLATIEIAAWDNSTGLYPTWTQASVAWLGGLIAAGTSGAFNVANIGGQVNTAPYMAVPSFNMYMVPEPSTFALVGLGAAAMLIFRRRK